MGHRRRPGHPETSLPKSVDVAVIGSGYTGLHAAIQVARGGRDTLVLDAEKAGWGCSTRNGGQISTSLKYAYRDLEKRYGKDIALKIMEDGKQSLEWTEKFIKTENIDCDFANVGRFHAAHNPAQFKKLSVQIQQEHPDYQTGAYTIARAEQRQELGSDSYHGGGGVPQTLLVKPGKVSQGPGGKSIKRQRPHRDPLPASPIFNQMERNQVPPGIFLLHLKGRSKRTR